MKGKKDKKDPIHHEYEKGKWKTREQETQAGKMD